MRHNLHPPELAAIARETFEQTERMLEYLAIALPFPPGRSLPWGVRAVQVPVDSAGGLWRVGESCKKRAGLAIIASVELRESELWYHVSFSRAKQMPSYEDMAWVHQLWMAELWAIQCFVPRAKHVNIHPNCLHLWHCMTGARPFPQFAVDGNI